MNYFLSSIKRYLYCYLAIAILFLTACNETQITVEPAAQVKVVNLDNTVKIIRGQTVYVRVYSHIYAFDRNQRREFATTLNIRNTDLTNPIIVTSANYYNTDGKIVDRL